MGNRQSVAQQIQQNINKPPVILPPPPPPDPSVIKEQKRVELNMAKADVIVKQNEYDKLTPNEAVKRKTDEALAEAEIYINRMKDKINQESRLHEFKLDEIKTLANNPAFKLAQKYKNEVSEKLGKLSKENQKFKEAYATNRRRFLDANPHESIEGIAGFKSLDDRIFFLFWLCFIIFIIPVSYYIITLFGEKIGDSSTQSKIWIASIVVSCIFAHLCLKYLA
jgi:hypothetical protein